MTGVEGQSPIGSEFRRSVLWQKAQQLSVRITVLVRDLPHDRAANAIASQLMRSGASIAANIAEGYGRYSQAAYRNHLSIARGSAFETESWLDHLQQSGYLSAAEADDLIAMCTEVQRLVTARMKTLSNGKSYASKEEIQP